MKSEEKNKRISQSKFKRIREIKNVFRSCLASVALSAFVALNSGCELEEDVSDGIIEQDIVPWASISNDFEVIYPKSGEVVTNYVIDLIGVGFYNGSYMDVKVKTDIWYDQPGYVKISKNGSWRFRDVHLGGYEHTIDVVGVYSNGNKEHSVINNVFVK